MPTFVDTPQVASLLADPQFKAGIVNRIPLRRDRRDWATSSGRRSSSAPTPRRSSRARSSGSTAASPRPSRNQEATDADGDARARAGHAERLHDDEAPRLQPQLRRDVGRRRRHRHAAAADAGGRDARGGRAARPDPLPDQHREPRRPHLRQLLVPRRRRDRQPQGAVGHLHGPQRGARPVRLRARGDPDRRPRRGGDPARPRRLLRRPAAGHGRVHRRPDAEGRRPHVPLPVDARPHARPARRPRPRGAGRVHRRHDLQRLSRRG